MANPITPVQFRDLVPAKDEGLCTVLVKWFKMQLLTYKYHQWKWGEDGQFTAQFKADLCADYRKRGCGQLD